MHTALLSVIAALLLFAIASMFDDGARWQPEPVAIPEMNPQRDSGLRGPVRTMSAAENCARAEAGLKQSVGGAQRCESDDDCTTFDFGYPIQCLTSVAKAEISALRLEFRQYQANCEFRVYYDCPSGDTERRAVCKTNRCEVELVTLDGLKEETLDHLGIRPRDAASPPRRQ